jgi:integrase
MPRKGPGLRIERRADTGALTIVGTVAGQRIRKRAASDDDRLAKEEAATLETELLRADWHGERRGTRSLAEAVNSYLATAPRAEGTKDRLNRLLLTTGDIKLGAVNQQTANRAAKRLLAPDTSPATLKRSIVTPLRAVMNHAFRQGWCDPPIFEIPRERTLYVLPSEAERLIAAANPALAVLIRFILGTGARMSEALELDWRDVDLQGARAIFWKTKNGKPRKSASRLLSS